MESIPISKAYEAYSAIADNRVEKKDENIYLVTSSDHSKKYTVKIDNSIYSSNDNATYWQHYAGYPILAVLLYQGLIPYNQEIGSLLKGIPWKKLNTKHHNHYDKAIEEALSSLSQEEKQNIQSEMNQVLNQAMNMSLTIKGNREKLIALK